MYAYAYAYAYAYMDFNLNFGYIGYFAALIDTYPIPTITENIAVGLMLRSSGLYFYCNALSDIVSIKVAKLTLLELMVCVKMMRSYFRNCYLPRNPY